MRRFVLWDIDGTLVDSAGAGREAFADALAHPLAARAEAIAERGRPYPGATEAIERLAAEPDLLQSLLTGNIERNAAVKLAAVGLDEHLDRLDSRVATSSRRRERRRCWRTCATRKRSCAPCAVSASPAPA